MVSIVGSIGINTPVALSTSAYTNPDLRNIYIKSNRRRRATEGAETIAYPSRPKPAVPVSPSHPSATCFSRTRIQLEQQYAAYMDRDMGTASKSSRSRSRTPHMSSNDDETLRCDPVLRILDVTSISRR